MPETPDVGRLLQPFFSQIAAASRPVFLAKLERIAAERYRHWATVVPDHSTDLLACADDEESVASKVEGLFTIDDSTRATMESLMDSARTGYGKLFEGRDVLDQLRIQAAAEREGAKAWRNVASKHPDAAARATLEQCAVLEERSANRLDAIIG